MPARSLERGDHWNTNGNEYQIDCCTPDERVVDCLMSGKVFLARVDEDEVTLILPSEKLMQEKGT